MKYLLVVAHPDDEVLGAGASINKWCKDGDTVDVAIMCTEANARAFLGDLKLIVWPVLAILYTACGKYPQWMHDRRVEYSKKA